MKNPASTSAQHLMSEFRQCELFYSLKTSNLQILFSWDRNFSLQLSPFPLLLVKGSYENHQVGTIGSERLGSHQGLPGEQRVGNRATGDLPEEKHYEYSTYLEERAFPRMFYAFSGKLTFLHSLSSVCFPVLSPVLLCRTSFLMTFAMGGVPHSGPQHSSSPNPHSRYTELLGDSKFPHVCCSVSCSCSLPPSTSEFISTYPQLYLWSSSHIHT